ncbi:YtpI family protein [Metasolibacillus meyeri]|uniref:YtpI family protein n=1 Tax=Metasolibacillus meyeri TaxID=1071052 RepID=A0AAW9NXV4_9BACL|nr:YtpI family protein [Metasolibacillus meyeri]MEC1180391.1 YtpI family protein [Metasolibacillus meyeri]
MSNVLNFIFVFFIVVSFVFYFYYKTKQFRSTLPIRKKWYTAKAGVALGTFIIAFGLNATIIYPTSVGYGVAIVFTLIGAGLAYNNYKRARHEGKYVHEEFELNK